MKIKGMRRVILSLIVLVTIINILDRGTLNYMWQDEIDNSTGAVIQTGIASELRIVNYDMPAEERQQRAKEVFAIINICFMIAYGISQLLSGAMYDRVGTRNGFTISALISASSVGNILVPVIIPLLFLS
jgi:ACS family hexuronate transporter-like MFS transporter